MSVGTAITTLLLTINAIGAFSTPTSPPKKALGHPPVEIWPDLVVGGKEDPALGHIERYQTQTLAKPYGDMLDAGTGIYSLRWLAGLLYRHSDPKDKCHMSSYVAVTADDNFKRDVGAKAVQLGIDDRGEVIVGNWAAGYNNDGSVGGTEGGEEELCQGRMFDTILADYLVGAVDFFAPFFQDQLFHRLSKHLKPGGTMYLTGLNPIPEKAEGVADLFCRVTKLRDACILLTRSRPYREHPTNWVVRHLELAGLKVVDVSTFPNKYNYGKIKAQIDAAKSTLQFMTNDEVRSVMEKQIDELDQECKEALNSCPDGSFELGFDWVITAVKEE